MAQRDKVLGALWPKQGTVPEALCPTLERCPVPSVRSSIRYKVPFVQCSPQPAEIIMGSVRKDGGVSNARCSKLPELLPALLEGRKKSGGQGGLGGRKRVAQRDKVQGALWPKQGKVPEALCPTRERCPVPSVRSSTRC